MKIYKLIGPKTQIINLHGKTLMPGFVDSHSHFSFTAVRYAQGFDISPPPFGNVASIPQLLANLKDFIAKKNIPAG
jgi:predicted amidohydrolase YtcJ